MDRRKFVMAAAAGTAIGSAATSANAQKYPFPIIDTHVHLYDPTRPQGVPWPDPVTQPSIYRRFLPADYRKIAEPFGVVGMIETECSPWVEDNYWVLEVSANETIVVGEVGDLVPGRSDFGEHLSRLHKNPLYRGIRFTNLWGRNVTESLKDPQAMADLRMLSDAGLALDMTSGPGGIPDLMRVTDAIPDLRIVLDHLPGSRVPDEPGARDAYLRGLREAAQRKVYVKFSEIFQRVDEKGRRVTSGGRIPRDLNFYRPWLDEIWEIFGPDRLLYASDWSNSEPMSTFGETLAMVHEYVTQKDPTAIDKVFWEEFARGIPVGEAGGEPAQLDLNQKQTTRKTTGDAMTKNIAGALTMAALTAAALMTAKAQAQTPPAPAFAAAQKQFDGLCEGCHGEGANGGDRAPALVNNVTLRTLNEAQIRDLIRTGTSGGMPAFNLPESELQSLAQWLRSLNMSAFDSKPAGNVQAGGEFFSGKGQCSTCHMVHGRGAVKGPDLSAIGRRSTVRELELVLENPTSQMGIHTTSTCPRWAFCPDETWQVVNVKLRDGASLRGFARGRAEHDLELQTLDGRLHFLTDRQYLEIAPEKMSYMPPLQASAGERRDLIAYLSSLGGVPPGALAGADAAISSEAIDAVLHPKPGEWPTYNGVLGANRHSALDQINTGNVQNLQLEWVYSLNVRNLETTPVVSDGVMYVTSADQVCALSATTGRELWCYRRADDPSASGGRRNSGSPNRGVGLLGDRVFFTTSDAHLICLNRLNGALMWDVNMVQSPGRFGTSSAPLIVGDLVIAGISGGDAPLREFLAAYKATSGEQAWRFWTVPKPGEPGSETWKGTAMEMGGGATWLTGSYDAETGTLYWAVGNPFPATDGDERAGANLYTNCVIALDVKTGKLRWYYQFTPHDLHDWDATEPMVLVDTEYRGRPRKLLLQANRNGFVYVLDRTTGEFLLAKPFVRKMNWASGFGSDGKPRLLPANKPTPAGVLGCPSVRGATNWYATAFNPDTKLFYVMSVEDCSIYRQTAKESQGYEGVRNPGDPGLKYLRAIDIQTGATAWEIPQQGPQEANYSGVLTTAGGLVFYGETGGGFAAVDARSGKTLWTIHGNQAWRGCPMTYMLNGRQYIAVASGSNILTFALK